MSESLEDNDMDERDLKLLDHQEDEAKSINVYFNNRLLFLIQSTLLGLSYAMIWPTVWPYIRDDLGYKFPYTNLVFGLTYVAYPVASMLSAHVVENIHLSAKTMILILNTFEIIGNIVYTLPYFPLLPLLGRFTAGLGDAFYVVLVKEMKSAYGHATNERMTIECLGAFIFGVIIAPGINIVTTFLHFKLGTWVLNSNNYPGLTMSVLFLLMQLIIVFFLSDQNDVVKNREGKDTKIQSRFIDAGAVIKHSTYKTVLITASSFFYTYIVASFELMIPLMLYEVLMANAIGAMLLYAVIGTLYAILLMMTMTISFKYQLETFLGLSLIVQVAGLFVTIYVEELYKFAAGSVLAMILLVFCLTVMWSNDDVLYINYVQMMIPPSARETTHNLRKFVSKIAFGTAGLTVPFWFSKAVFVVAPILIFIVLFLFVVFVVIRLVEQKQLQKRYK